MNAVAQSCMIPIVANYRRIARHINIYCILRCSTSNCISRTVCSQMVPSTSEELLGLCGGYGDVYIYIQTL